MADSDLDPKAFLQTVRDLSDKRKKEDAERYEKLEADIIQDRTARLARRIERERSLSPEKTPRSPRSFRSSEDRQTPTRDTPPPAMEMPSSPAREPLRNDSSRSRPSTPLGGSRPSTPLERPSSPSKASPSAAMPSRANTLSWQQRRPNSGIRTRPLSMLSNESAVAHPAASIGRETILETKEGSRNDIARSLGSKDPSWFKQTADRGTGSAAYRRSRDEEQCAVIDTQKRQLPGLMKGLSFDEPKESNAQTESVRSDQSSRFGSVRDSATSRARNSDNVSGYGSAREQSTPATDRMASPETEQPAFSRTAPSLQKRISVDRPASPTKGMGGFVQSAMLKRSDSVNKRWSAQPAGGLSRQDSTASIRSGIGGAREGLPGSRSMPRLDTAPDGESESRPTSSHSQISNVAMQEPEQRDRSMKPTSSLHSRAKSMASLREAPEQTANLQATFSPPLSPSKRWSPTKASWLESALARPESPKPSTQPTQPSWMTDLSKAKQQRTSADSTPSLHNGEYEVNTASSTSVRSFQPVVVSGLNQGVTNKTPINRDVKKVEEAANHSAPPTRTKPQGLGLHATSTSPAMVEVSKDAPRPASQPKSDFKEFTPKTAPLEVSAPAKASSVASTIGSIRSKPVTPPKKDFRSALKSRQGPADGPAKEEPEFKNVFGKLRKTQPERFVAPDELKNNILRGKAGLINTDGPQKTERRDELKESLLKKKEEMKAKQGQEDTKKVAAVPHYPETPEAILRKKQLGRTDSSSSLDKSRRDITPEALSRHRTMKSKTAPQTPEKPKFGSDRPLSISEKTPLRTTMPSSTAVEASGQMVEEPVDKTVHKTVEGPAEKPVQKSIQAPVVAQEQPKAVATVSTKFANRFNPALAGLLARGPPLAGKSSTARSLSPPGTVQLSATGSADADSGAQLTHMTKSRAKGPKRRKPNSKESSTEATDSIASAIQQPKRPISQNVGASMPLQPPPKSAAVRAVSMTLSRTPEKEKPTTPTKSASLSLKSSPAAPMKLSPSAPLKSNSLPEPMSASRNNVGPARQVITEPWTSSPEVSVTKVTAGARLASSRDLLSSQQADDDKENSNASVKNAASRWGHSPQAKSSPQRGMPIKLPSREDEQAAMRSAGLLSSSPLRYNSQSTGLGISAEKTGSPRSSNYPISPPSSAGLPPRPAKSSRVVSSSIGTKAPKSDTGNLDDIGTTPAGRCIAKHFGSTPLSDLPLDIDTHAVLSARSRERERIKTLRKSIQEVSGDGKLIPLPAQEEHILFDSSMYICTHVYGSANGARTTEVYLWAGVGISEAAIDDAQVLAKKVAKEASAGSRSAASVQVIRQAREPAGFFQALGGIVIVRRGSRAEAATKSYMLCGRPHVKHVAFDEVDLSLGSLYSGLPCIISKPVTLQNTKIYLWKGSGCGPETIGSARLISMDLDTSGDVVEVQEGSETSDFLDLFSADPIRSMTKGTTTVFSHPTDNLAPRLFRIDALPPRRSSSTLFWPTSLLSRRPSWTGSRPSSSTSVKSGNLSSPEMNVAPKMTATEMVPVSQADIEPENVYVLDCIHTLYVLPGPLLSSSNYWEQCFCQALLFANEYAILAASEEDRPAVPAAKVVLGNLPREARILFRHWESRRGLWGTGGMMAGRKADGDDEDAVEVEEAVRICCR